MGKSGLRGEARNGARPRLVSGSLIPNGYKGWESDLGQVTEATAAFVTDTARIPPQGVSLNCTGATSRSGPVLKTLVSFF